MRFHLSLMAAGHRKIAGEILRASRRVNRLGPDFHHYVLAHAYMAASRRRDGARQMAQSPSCCTVGHLMAHSDMLDDVSEAFRVAHNRSDPPPASFLLAKGWTFL
jgi:hypothetical protein